MMKSTLRIFGIFILLLAIMLPVNAAASSGVVSAFHNTGVVAEGGSWEADVQYSDDTFVIGDTLTITTTLEIDSLGLAYNLGKTQGLYCLVTATRLFDGAGQYIGDAAGLLSTRLDPQGMPIETEDYKVPHPIFGSDRISPITSYVSVPASQIEINKEAGTAKATFISIIPIDDEIPSGYYKIRLDIGIEASSTVRITLGGVDPASIDATDPGQSYISSRVVNINADANPRMIWTLFSQFHSSGGAIAMEDKGLAGLSRRHGSFDRVFIPLKDEFGRQVRYLLEPDFPGELNPFLNRQDPAIGLDFKKGWLSLRVKNPDGSVIECGSSPFTMERGLGATTGSEAFFFSFSQYGKHFIECKGWIADQYGTIYEGGGVYEVWVAQPIQIDPATPPGRPLQVNELYNTALHLYPSFPADVDIFQSQDRLGLGKIDSRWHHIKANRFGQFVPNAGDARDRTTRSGIVSFKDPGVYRVQYYAEYKEADGTLWMGQLESFGIVYNPALTVLDAGGTAVPEVVLPFPESNNPTNKAFRDEYPQNVDELIYLPDSNYSFFDPILTFKPAQFPEIFRGDEDVLVSVGDLYGLRSGTGTLHPAISYPEEIIRDGYQMFSAVRSDKSSQMGISEISQGQIEHPHHNPFNAGELPRDNKGDYYLLSGGLNFGDVESTKFLQLPYVASAFVSDSYGKPIFYAAGEVDINWQGGARKMFPGFPAIYPGDILQAGDAYMLDSIVLPNVTADYQIAMTKPDGSIIREKGSSDKNGFIGGPDQWLTMDQEGVYTISYTLFRGEVTGYPLGTNQDTEGSFRIYGIGGNNNLRVDFKLGRMTELPEGQAFSLRGDVSTAGITGGQAYISISFQGSLVIETTADITDGMFGFNLDPDAVSALYSNYSSDDPSDRLDITFFVSGITAEGKIRYAADRLYTLGKYIYSIPMAYADIKVEDRRSRLEKKEKDVKAKEYRRSRGLKG